MSHHLPEQSEDDLLRRIRHGDEQAFLDLYRQRHSALYRFALHMAGSSSVAEDIIQEVFLILISDTSGFDPSRGSLSSYLFGIAHKLILRYLRRNHLDIALVDLPRENSGDWPRANEDPLEDLTRREGIETLHRAVLALPRKYREVVILCDLEETDYAEAAVILGCPIGTVRSRLHRARALLMEKLHQERSPNPQAGSLKPLRYAI